MFRGTLPCSKRELQLVGTLNGGQSFRWQQRPNQSWIGVVNGCVWILEQRIDHIDYEVHDPHLLHANETNASHNDDKYNRLLIDYFQLKLNLCEQYEAWSQKDPHFRKSAVKFYGIRVLKQAVVENIFSFICSQNNHISRITSLVEKLARFYGERIATVDGVDYFAFPQLEALARPDVEGNLRDHGFGYRSKYISKCAQAIAHEGGAEFLQQLQAMDYARARERLIALPGIGPKLADCICLMSLGHLEAIPVDVHIFNIAVSVYMPKLAKHKSVTKGVYEEIAGFFRNLYGPLAGWAHLVLFCADLKKIDSVENDQSETNCNKKLKVA